MGVGKGKMRKPKNGQQRWDARLYNLDNWIYNTIVSYSAETKKSLEYVIIESLRLYITYIKASKESKIPFEELTSCALKKYVQRAKEIDAMVDDLAKEELS